MPEATIAAVHCGWSVPVSSYSSTSTAMGVGPAPMKLTLGEALASAISSKRRLEAQHSVIHSSRPTPLIHTSGSTRTFTGTEGINGGFSSLEVNHLVCLREEHVPGQLAVLAAGASINSSACSSVLDISRFRRNEKQAIKEKALSAKRSHNRHHHHHRPS